MNIININLSLLLLLLLVVVVVPSEEAAAPPPFSDPDADSCSNNDNTTDYSENVDRVLTQLESATENRKFNYTSSYNQHSNKSINGRAQCRSDLPQAVCSSCVKNATSAIRTLLKSIKCRNATDMWVWYNACFLMYSIQNFFGRVDTSGIYFYNTANVTGSKIFDQTLTNLTNEISAEAVEKFVGKGNSTVVNLKKPNEPRPDHIYGLVQCTQDLSPEGCESCLAQATGKFYDDHICRHRKGCRVLYSSCFARYEIYPF